MFKIVKLLVLLVIVACIVIGVYAYVRSSDQAGSGPVKSGETVVPVEEKYGFTTETVDP